MDGKRISKEESNESGHISSSSSASSTTSTIILGDVEYSDSDDDEIGTRYRLTAGDTRNPEYSRSSFIRRSADEVIVAAIQIAQKKSALRNQRTFAGQEHSYSFPSDSELFTRLHPDAYSTENPTLVMAGNGFPTQYLKMKTNGNGAATNNTDNSSSLDDDLRRKVETLKIDDAVPVPENQMTPDGKSYDDWKDELPIHLKSLKFMINVLNDRHINPSEFASSTLDHIPAPVFGPEFKNFDIIRDTWSDPVYPKVGDRLHPPHNPRKILIAERPLPLNLPRSRELLNSRRRTKSAEPDLSSYRDETPIPRKGHRYSDFALPSSTYSFNKRRSIDLNGVYVVEEISEEDEEVALIDSESPNSLEFPLQSSEPTFGGGGGDRFNLLDLPKNKGSPLRSSASRIRRDLWNISPISEDFTESEKELERTMDISSTNATIGDYDIDTADLSFQSRLSCSSPILSHSPSLRKTPVNQHLNGAYGLSGMDSSTPTGGKCGNGGGSGPSSLKKVRDITRALDDISDKEDEHVSTAEESSSSGDEEKTESFEIDFGQNDRIIM